MDEPSKPPPLPYEERASFVSRKQYRRLMALTLLNTILLATFVCGPAAQNLIESRWARFQRWQAARWMQKQQRASNAAAANYMLPAETVVYEERPAEAIRLLDAGSWSYTSPWQVYNPLVPPRPWQPAVVLRDASLPAFRTIGTEETVVFVHSMNTPSGKPILIAVILADRQQHGLESTTNDRKVFQVFPRSMIYAIEVRDDGTAPKLGELTEAQEDMPQAEVIWRRGKSNYAREEAAVTFTTAGMLTVYAGQVDSADPSHLTIGYAIDGQRSTIDGWLRSETLLELLPRTGTIARRTNNGRSVSWNPLITPSSQPATSPAASK